MLTPTLARFARSAAPRGGAFFLGAARRKNIAFSSWGAAATNHAR